MTRPYRVLHVITRLELGGAQRNTLYTVGHLDRRSFRTALAWGPGDILDQEAEDLEGVALFRVPALVREVRPVRDTGALLALRRVLRELRPDIVHTHSSKAGILGRLAARLEKVPAVVHSVHGFGFTPVQPWPVRALFLSLERLAGRWTDHFIAVSHANRNRGIALGLFRPDQVSVIRSGVRLAAFEDPDGGDDLRSRLGIPAGTPLVTQVGNFKPQKAPLDFVRAAVEVARAAPEAHFLMVGDGPLRTRAEALAGDAGLEGRMHFTGWSEEVPAVLAASDVAVLTSRHEGLPRAAVEAVAAGVPVVATAVDGTPEVVREGETGFLVAAGDVAGTAGAVLRLLDDPELRHRLGARPSWLDEFDIDCMVRQHEDLYRCLLGTDRS